MSQKTGRSLFSLIAEGYTPANTGGIIDLTPKYKVEKSELTYAVFVAPAAGTAGNSVITFGGTYAVDDVIKITLVSNLRTNQLYRRTFTYTVPQGGTAINDIATAVGAIINREVGDFGSPIGAVGVAGPVVTVTQDGDDKKGLISYVFTDSTAGTIVGADTTTVYSEGQPDDLVDAGIDPAEINLAQYDTVKIVLNADVPIPFIDSEGHTAREILWYGTPGEGAALAALINA